MFLIRDTLNGSNLDEDFHYSLTSEEIAKFTIITSCDVEKTSDKADSFRKYKNILRIDRGSNIFGHFKHYIIV